MRLRDWLFGFKGQGAPAPVEPGSLPTEDEVAEARDEAEAWAGMTQTKGWKLLREDLEHNAQAALDAWVKGGLDQEQASRLASRLETIRWVLRLPEQKIASYNEFQRDLREMADDRPDPSGL